MRDRADETLKPYVLLGNISTLFRFALSPPGAALCRTVAFVLESALPFPFLEGSLRLSSTPTDGIESGIFGVRDTVEADTG